MMQRTETRSSLKGISRIAYRVTQMHMALNSCFVRAGFIGREGSIGREYFGEGVFIAHNTVRGRTFQ